MECCSEGCLTEASYKVEGFGLCSAHFLETTKDGTPIREFVALMEQRRRDDQQKIANQHRMLEVAHNDVVDGAADDFAQMKMKQRVCVVSVSARAHVCCSIRVGFATSSGASKPPTGDGSALTTRSLFVSCSFSSCNARCVVQAEPWWAGQSEESDESEEEKVPEPAAEPPATPGRWRCVPCNRDFSKNSSRPKHEESRTHRDAVAAAEVSALYSLTPPPPAMLLM